MKPRQIVFVLVVAVIGVLIGGLFGMQQDPGHRTTHTVALDDVVRTGGNSASRVVSFMARLQRDETRERAAEATSFEPDDFTGVFARRVDDTMAVEVEFRTATAGDAVERLDALIEAALLEEIDAERATEQIVIDRSSAEVAELDAELAALYRSVDLAPGTDLASRREQDRFNLVSAEAQLAALPEDETYWNVRLPGDIVAYETRIATIDRHLDRWLEIDERRDELDSSYDSSSDRLVELASADDIAMAGTAVVTGSPEAISPRATAGRWAAVIGLISFLAALVIVAAGSILHRPAPAHDRSERTSAATAT